MRSRLERGPSLLEGLCDRYWRSVAACQMCLWAPWLSFAATAPFGLGLASAMKTTKATKAASRFRTRRRALARTGQSGTLRSQKGK